MVGAKGFLFLICVGSLGSVSWAQSGVPNGPYFDSVDGPSFGGMVATAISQAQDVSRQKAALTKHIEAARQRFWSEYPDGANFEEAKAEFDRALFSKDLSYLLLQVSYGTQFGSMLQQLTGGEVDDGIRPGARDAFTRWTEEVQKTWHRSGMARLPAAVEASQPIYREYVILRDVEEFCLQGRKPPGLDETTWYVLQLLMTGRRTRTGRASDHHVVFNEMVELFGEDHVREVAERIAAAPQAENGRLTPPLPAPADFGEWSDDNAREAFMNHLGAGTPRYFALGMIRLGFNPHTPEGMRNNWRYAAESYQRFVQQSGEERLLEVTERIRSASKTAVENDGLLSFHLDDPEAVGCLPGMVGPTACLRTILRGASRR